jgi:tRNA (cmo5U34)-methyltransferase
MDPIDSHPTVWNFQNEKIADGFDAHVRSQLPFYDTVSRFTADILISFLPTNGVLYDIGASTGNLTRLLEEELKAKKATVISIEPSPDMCARFQGFGFLVSSEAQMVNFSHKRPNVAIMFLTLMFLPAESRGNFLRKLAEDLQPGGIIIIVDKGYIRSPALQVACKAATLAEKKRAGMSAEAYVAKELSLRGELRPVDENNLIELLENENLKVEMFFRHGEFYGIAAIKDAL